MIRHLLGGKTGSSGGEVETDPPSCCIRLTKLPYFPDDKPQLSLVLRCHAASKVAGHVRATVTSLGHV